MVIERKLVELDSCQEFFLGRTGQRIKNTDFISDDGKKKKKVKNCSYDNIFSKYINNR